MAADSPHDWRQAVPVLAGDFVRVREVASEDASAFLELLGDPAVREHISPPPPTLAAFEGFILWAQRERALGSGVCFGIVPEGLQQAVGLIQLRALEPGFFTAEWGFALGAAFWSTGVFQQAARLVTRFAFDTLKVHRLEARAVSRNGRGNGALLKLGAKAEAVLSRSFRRNGDYEEQLLWSLLATDGCPDTSDRFAASDTKDRIARAVGDTLQHLRIPRAPTRRPPPLYPFFVTDSSGPRVCPTCGTPLAGAGVACRTCR